MEEEIGVVGRKMGRHRARKIAGDADNWTNEQIHVGPNFTGPFSLLSGNYRSLYDIHTFCVAGPVVREPAKQFSFVSKGTFGPFELTGLT